MNARTLTQTLDAERGNRAMDLLARTTLAMRTDAAYLEREDDVAAAVFLDDEAPAPLAADALNRVLGLIDEAATKDADAAGAAAGGAAFKPDIAALPSPVREAALDALAADGRWKFAGLGIQRLALFSDDGAQAILMRIEPGHGVAEHDHEGDELTLVLTGAYNDGEAAYRPGDVSLARPGFVHTPKAEPGEVCYVLLAYRGAPKFKGFFGLAQRWFGFPARLTKPD
jgi:putative transcriptional regulator